ncbi:hypothetical protein [Escherichia coli]|uniref:hypothetical protein n=1 Tax=Escherichia coli TaxID=562 RepID=UPI001CD992C3|nr:hypothetical protein [Escherichia coli]MCA2074978.1 hypothetical protein [Escherichia coli]
MIYRHWDSSGRQDGVSCAVSLVLIYSVTYSLPWLPSCRLRRFARQIGHLTGFSLWALTRSQAASPALRSRGAWSRAAG